MGNLGESWGILGNRPVNASRMRANPSANPSRIHRECVRICVNFCESATNARMDTARIAISSQRSLRSRHKKTGIMAILAVPIRAFAADSRKFTQIRTHSRRIRGWIRAHSRRIRGLIPEDSPRFPRIPQDSPRIYADSRICPTFTGSARIYADSRKFARHVRRFAHGFTRIRESSRMDIRGFAQDSQRLVIIPRRESANGNS